MTISGSASSPSPVSLYELPTHIDNKTLVEALAADSYETYFAEYVKSLSGLPPKFYWSRAPGEFVNKTTGKTCMATNTVGIQSGPSFVGTVREWYETLVETIMDSVRLQHAMNNEQVESISVSPDVGTILEHTYAYTRTYRYDSTKPIQGWLQGRVEVLVDKTLPVNIIKVGKMEVHVLRLTVLDTDGRVWAADPDSEV